MKTDRYFTYRAFGLVIASEFEIEELRPCERSSAVDVTIRFAALGLLDRNGETLNPAEPPDFSFSEDRQVVIAPAVGAFVIDGYNSVYVERRPGVSDALLAVVILGPVFAILLHLHNTFVLHGSAVIFDGKAYGFLGDKGAGKSTLSAMLLKNQSVELLTDDLLVISESLKALRGYPQMKLSDEAIEYADMQIGSVRPPPHTDFPKNQFLLHEHAMVEEVQVGGIFELRRASEAKIETLSQADAIRTLLRYSYISRFEDRKMSSVEQQNMFIKTTKLAAKGIVNRLFVPDRIAKLDKVIDTLRDLSF